MQSLINDLTELGFVVFNENGNNFNAKKDVGGDACIFSCIDGECSIYLGKTPLLTMYVFENNVRSVLSGFTVLGLNLVEEKPV